MTVTIGKLANVPAPGDDIRSPWAQDVTQLGLHAFTTKATLDAATPTWVGLGNGARAITLDNGRIYTRQGGAWYPQCQVLFLYRHSTDGPIGVGAGTDWPASPAITIPAGRRLRVTGRVHVQGTATTVILNAKMDAVAAGISRMAQIGTLPAGTTVLHGSTYIEPAAGAHTFTINVGANAAGVTQLSAADSSWFSIEDVGAV